MASELTENKKMIVWEHKKIAVDSMIMIYILDHHPKYGEKALSILSAADQIIFSSLLYGEVLAGFYRVNDMKGLERFYEFTNSLENLSIQDFDRTTAGYFATLRAKNNFLTSPDCIHLASALQMKADVFFTNDKKIKSMPELKVVYLEDFI